MFKSIIQQFAFYTGKKKSYKFVFAVPVESLTLPLSGL